MFRSQQLIRPLVRSIVANVGSHANSAPRNTLSFVARASTLAIPTPKIPAPDKPMSRQAIYDTCKPVMVGCDNTVPDIAQSHGSILVDMDGHKVVDCYSSFASQALGHNHPALSDPHFENRLLRAAKAKPANPDMPNENVARFILAFQQLLPAAFRDPSTGAAKLFFIDGGSAAVENALKAAMDARGRDLVEAGILTEAQAKAGNLHTGIIHFKRAFHGRGGYTLSLTNTDPGKIDYFARFDHWPRVSSPFRTFPATAESDAAAIKAEAQALGEIRAAIAAQPHGLSAIVLEAIQAEGGDHHFRPEFLRELRTICDAHGLYLIFDEVQAGMGITGKAWAFEHSGVMPDLFAFGKKAQVCGVAARHDFRAGKDSVFSVASRINSTWGGNSADYVRSEHTIRTILLNDYIGNAARRGAELKKGLEKIAERHSNIISNARGQGLMCAFDLRDTNLRNAMYNELKNHRFGPEKMGVLALKRGDRALGFRPFLDVDAATIQFILNAVETIAGHLN